MSVPSNPHTEDMLGMLGSPGFYPTTVNEIATRRGISQRNAYRRLLVARRQWRAIRVATRTWVFWRKNRSLSAHLLEWHLVLLDEYLENANMGFDKSRLYDAIQTMCAGSSNWVPFPGHPGDVTGEIIWECENMFFGSILIWCRQNASATLSLWIKSMLTLEKEHDLPCDMAMIRYLRLVHINAISVIQATRGGNPATFAYTYAPESLLWFWCEVMERGNLYPSLPPS